MESHPSQADSEGLGFELDDDLWLQRLRAHRDPPTFGKLGSYDLLAVIGRGGQGLVYRARQPRTGRDVALKRLSAGAFATLQMRARFEREIEAASVLDHPNIVTIFGTETIDDQPVLTMKWVDGVPIDHWALPEGASRRPLHEVLEVFVMVCDAVYHAHQRGVIHRDLKPSNILVDRQSRPHVLDFGLAKLDQPTPDTAMTVTGEFLGTPAYASPEQLRGDARAVDVRTDVYALGAILYRLLTGRVPFPDAGDLEILVASILNRVPQRPSSHNPTLNREIDVIVLKALAKDKDQRYASVETFAADIRRYLSGKAVLAHPPRLGYRLRKFIRAHRLAVAAAGAVFMTLIVGTLVSTSLYFRADRQRQRAEAETAKQREIQEFLGSVLSKSDPALAGGQKEMTVLQALDGAAGEIDAPDTPHSPEVKAALQYTIAAAYIRLGVFDRAVPLLEKCVELRRRLGPDARRELADALGLLAQPQHALGDFIGAERNAREAIAFWDELPGDHREERAISRNGLFLILKERGNKVEAHVIGKEMVDLLVDRHGQDHILVAIALTNAAPASPTKDENRTLLERAIAIYRKHPDEGRNMAYALTSLASWHRRAGALQLAESLELEALAILTQLYGDDRIHTAISRKSLALIYLDLGRLDLAEEYAIGAFRLYQKALGDDHRLTWDMKWVLARILLEQREFFAAEHVLRSFLEYCEQPNGAAPPTIAYARSQLGRSLHGLGLHEEAETEYAESIRKLRELGAGPHPELVLKAQLGLGRLYIDQDRLEDADAILVESLAFAKMHELKSDLAAVELAVGELKLRQRLFSAAIEQFQRALTHAEIFPAGHWTRTDAYLGIGQAFQSLGDYDSAETNLLAAYQEASKGQNSDFHRQRDTIVRLVNFHTARQAENSKPNSNSQAEIWRSKLTTPSPSISSELVEVLNLPPQSPIN